MTSSLPIRWWNRKIVQHYRKADGELVELTLVFVRWGLWVRCDESRDQTWRTTRLGPFALAWRIVE